MKSLKGFNMKIRKIIHSSALVGLLVMPIMTQASSIGIVTADQLNVRKTPSLSGVVIKRVTSGTTLKMLGRDEVNTDWYQILLDNSEVAYVKDEFVRLSTIKGHVNENNLNFRSYPSLTQSKVMKKLKKGTEVTVLYKVGDFYKILVDQSFGFVYAPYVDVPFADAVTLQDLSVVKDVLQAQDNMVDLGSSNQEVVDINMSLDLISEETSKWLDNEESVEVGVQESSEYIPINTDMGDKIVAYAMQFVGNPYVYGGNDLMTGVDCSGYTQQVMKAFNISIPRTSLEQSKVGMLITDFSMLQSGDLLFFGESKDAINHVAIYISDNCIVHASTPQTGIIISNLSEKGSSDLQVMRRMVQ